MSIDEDAEQAISDVRAWATSQAATFAVWKAMPPGWERFRPEFKAAQDAYHYEEHLSLRAEHKRIVSEEFVRSVTIVIVGYRVTGQMLGLPSSTPPHVAIWD